ncbi:hypothetical protein EDB85DRAFT_2148164 [Lactarius pseudohatsudake]|nr:hypothetical protein EDB85DRAFT_2148164 [Lactarius pseudohatsudake]
MPLGLRALPSPPSAPPHMRGRGAHKGMPPPPFSLSAAPHSCGKRAHEGTWPLPFPLGRATRKGGTRGHVTPRPLPSPLATPPRLSASPPPSSPSLFAPPRSCGNGAREARRPQHPFPPWLHRPVRAGRGQAKRHPLRHPSPIHAGTPPLAPPFPFGRAARYAREGGCEGIRADRGAHGHAALFAQEGAHEAKLCPPPHVSCSRASAVSVRPRSPRPHPVFARHSTT